MAAHDPHMRSANKLARDTLHSRHSHEITDMATVIAPIEKFVSRETAIDIVNELQNAGVLFFQRHGGEA